MLKCIGQFPLDFLFRQRITYTHSHNRFTAIWILSGKPGWAGTIRNIHPLTPIVVISHPLSASSIYYDPRHSSCSIYVPDSLFPQSLSKFSLIYLLAWHPQLHNPSTSYSIHFFTQSLSSFASHAHTKASNRESLGINGTGFLLAQSTSCHVTNSVKKPKETRSTDAMWHGFILSLSTTGLLKERPLLLLCWLSMQRPKQR